MKKNYLLSSMVCLASIVPSFGQIDVNLLSSKIETGKIEIGHQNRQALYGSTPEELLACPENTILDAAYREVAGGQMGQMAVDQGREGYQSTFYQSFSGCLHKINGLRVLATYSTFDGQYYWDPCTERGGVDENGQITKEIPLEIGFYEINEKGYPGKEVYKKVISVMGKATGTNAHYFPIYTYEVDLGEEVSLYNGFFSITAVKESEEPLSCWFSIVGSDTTPGKSLIYSIPADGEEGSWSESIVGSCYCLLGDGDFIAQKATDLNRIISPIADSNKMNEKVQVVVNNIGEQTIQDIDLELWYDGQLLATERVEDPILRGEALAYTFKQRVDCSDKKSHKLEIRNITEGLENFGAKNIDLTIKPSDYPVSKGIYWEQASSFISSVEVGNIKNQETGNDGYHDYSEMKTDIHKGELLTLNITVDGDLIPQSYGVWVDWNNNKRFDDDFEEMAYNNFANGMTTTTIDIEVPDEAELTTGDVRMRICATYGSEPIADNLYAIGETEDYTLTIIRNDNSPAFAIDTDVVDSEQKNGEKQTVDLTVSNEGKNEMNGDVEIIYTLPDSPIITPILDQMKGYEPSTSEYVLKYDGGALNQIGLKGVTSTTYATYYPSKMLKHLKGMKIESVDVYVYEGAANYTVIIYDENTRTSTGEILAEQPFEGSTHSWNTVKLDNPVEIGEKDVWVAVKFDGIEVGTYPIATDNGTAIVGYGGWVNIGDGHWWNLPELGSSKNVCIRANIGGTRTGAINWLSLDKNSYSINEGGQDVVKATITAKDLEEETLYEAVIRFSSNDEIKNVVNIPVYMTCLKAVGIDERQLSEEIKLSYQDRTLTIDSEKEVANVKVIGTGGQQVTATTGHVVNLTDVNDGIYIIMIQFADNSMTCVKLIVE